MYQPKFPPMNPDVKALASYVNDELQSVAQAQHDTVDFVQFNVLHAAPSKPKNGMVVCADGSDFNPDSTGAGGYFGYFGGSWAKLG